MDRPNVVADRRRLGPTPHTLQDRGKLTGARRMVEELARMPATGRSGPLIVNPRTGLPYRHEYFRVLWHKCAAEVGISRSIWNCDLRAGGITEARQAGASTDDVAKTAGHVSKRTTAKVYDRDTMEAARRVAKARIAHRNGA